MESFAMRLFAFVYIALHIKNKIKIKGDINHEN